MQQLWANLEIEKKIKEDLRHEFEAMEKESEMARAKQAEEIEKIKKASQETMSFLRQMLGPRDG